MISLSLSQYIYIYLKLSSIAIYCETCVCFALYRVHPHVFASMDSMLVGSLHHGFRYY